MLTEGIRPGAAPVSPSVAVHHGPSGRFGGGWRRAGIIVAVVVVAVALVRALVVQSFVIPTGSMEPTLQAGDRVLVSRLAYRFGSIERGDVVVFDGAGVFEAGPAPARNGLVSAGRSVARALGVPVGESDYVKRVIGLPGDRVTCCAADGRLTVDGAPIPEPYVDSSDVASTERFDVVVPPGRLWVMGDHRSASADSRAHLGDPGGGTVPEDRVVGRVVGIYWPFSRVGGIGRAEGTG